ncbi:MAG: endonuclease III [Bacilli bacterium]
MNNYLEELFPNPSSELSYESDYQLLLKVMLSAQTTDKRVNQVGDILFKEYKTLEELKNANIEDIKNIISPLGSFNKKSLNIINIARRLIEEQRGTVPNNREYLESLPGVGRKTTNVVLGMLYKVPCIAVDTHVLRVSKRLGLAKKDDTVIDVEKKLTELFKNDDMLKRHHQLLLFGRYYCKAINPKCEGCPLKNICQKDTTY